MKFTDGGTRPDGNKYNVNATNQTGHSYSNFIKCPGKTGGFDYSTNCRTPLDILYNDMSKNIYDLEGNVTCWTTQANGTRGRFVRGGSCFEPYSACSYTYSVAPMYPYDDEPGTILTLYIKP